MSDTLIELSRFGHDEAWRLGSALVERCRAEGLAVTITIRLGEQRVFHVALPGTSADNDSWADRKARVVGRFGLSSLEVFERHVRDNPDFFRLFAFLRVTTRYSEKQYRSTYAVPWCILAVSGLESEEDHALAADALRAEAMRQTA
jgi:uncharacterized protein (UPF0303 family)